MSVFAVSHTPHDSRFGKKGFEDQLTDGVVNVPDQKATCGKRYIVASQLTVLDQEVLLACSIAILPKSVHLEAGLDVRDGDLVVFGLVDDTDPALVRLAPWGISASANENHELWNLQADGWTGRSPGKTTPSPPPPQLP